MIPIQDLILKQAKLEGFLAGVEATKKAIIQDIIDYYEFWDQATTDERVWTVEEIEVELP